jgi:hypothetical protein
MREGKKAGQEKYKRLLAGKDQMARYTMVTIITILYLIPSFYCNSKYP